MITMKLVTAEYAKKAVEWSAWKLWQLNVQRRRWNGQHETCDSWICKEGCGMVSVELVTA